MKNRKRKNFLGAKIGRRLSPKEKTTNLKIVFFFGPKWSSSLVRNTFLLRPLVSIRVKERDLHSAEGQ